MSDAAPVEVGRRRHAKAVGRRILDCKLAVAVAGKIPPGLAIGRYEGVDVDKGRNPFRQPVGHAGDHHAGVAVAAQHDVLDLLEQQHIGHVLDMGVEVGPGGSEMRALAEAGQTRREDVVSAHAKLPRDRRQCPPAVPAASDHDELGHSRISVLRIKWVRLRIMKRPVGLSASARPSQPLEASLTPATFDSIR